MMSQFKSEVLKICVAQICQGIGFQGLYTIPLEVLVDILSRYISEVAVTTHRYTEHYGRTEPNLDDLGLAFKEMGISLSELEEYVSTVESVPFPHSIPKFPISRASSMNFLKPGSRETLSRPLHIHEHLPPMYPEREEEEVDSKVGVMDSVGSPLDASSPLSPSGGVMSPGSIKRSMDQPNLQSKKMRYNTEEEGQPVREVDSVMMTTGGFISSAREGKLPESRIPNIPMLLPRAVSPHPPSGLGGVRRKLAVEKIVRQKNLAADGSTPTGKIKPKLKPKLPTGQRPGSLPPSGIVNKKPSVLANKLAGNKGKSGSSGKSKPVKTELPEHIKNQMMSNLHERPGSLAILNAASLKKEPGVPSKQLGPNHHPSAPTTPKAKKICSTPPKLKMPTPKSQKTPKSEGASPAKGNTKENKEEGKKKSKKDKEGSGSKSKKEKVKKDKVKDKTSQKKDKGEVKKEKVKKEKSGQKKDKETQKKEKDSKKKEKKVKEKKDTGKKKDKEEKDRKERELIAALAASSAVSITPLFGRPPQVNAAGETPSVDNNKLSIFKKKGGKHKPSLEPILSPHPDDGPMPSHLDTPDFSRKRESCPLDLELLPLTPDPITEVSEAPKLPNSANFIPPFIPNNHLGFAPSDIDVEGYPPSFGSQMGTPPGCPDDMSVTMAEPPLTPTLPTPPPVTHKEKRKEHKKEKKEKEKEKIKKKKDKKAKTKEKAEKKKEKEKAKQDKRKTKSKDKKEKENPLTTPKLTVKLVSEQIQQISSQQPSTPVSHKHHESSMKSTPKIVIKPIQKPADLPPKPSTEHGESAAPKSLDEPGSPEIAKFSALITRPVKPPSDTPSKAELSTPKSSKHAVVPTTPSVPSISISKKPSGEHQLGSPGSVPPIKIKNPTAQMPTILTPQKTEEKKSSATTKKEKKRRSGPTEGTESQPVASSTPSQESTPRPRKSHPSAVQSQICVTEVLSSPQSSTKTSSSSAGLISETMGPIGHFVDDQGNEVWICPACGKQDDGSPMIGCDTCDDWYHWVCVGIQVPPSETENWYCPRCLSQHKQRGIATSEKKKRGRRKK